MKELIYRLAVKHFEEEKKANRKARLLAEGLKARAERLKSEGNTLGPVLVVKP
jgi:hypothetical protein